VSNLWQKKSEKHKIKLVWAY